MSLYVCGLPLYDLESWFAVDELSIPIVELDSTGLQQDAALARNSM